MSLQTREGLFFIYLFFIEILNYCNIVKMIKNQVIRNGIVWRIMLKLNII